jgi:hypothetical protein
MKACSAKYGNSGNRVTPYLVGASFSVSNSG